MGKYFFDRFSILHFAVGVLFASLGIDFVSAVLLATVFEIVENTKSGIVFINNNLKRVWPGGKDYADSKINSLGDVLFFALGWYIAKNIIA